ncbi:SRPBCC family protein [Aestuariivita boseongensis]|uniref:SRPBCC family protein n=1 Tax=Aestuariivita boseongensis TaxID=1470562 RepID=UPI000682C40A|nr:SRPBCC family protein [Aestuariivita boseongensis]
MKFSSKEDVEAPIASVFGMLSDFEIYERSAIRRGADVHRIGDHDIPHVGQAWQASFTFRGKERKTQVTLARYAIPTEMVFEGQSGGLLTSLALELVALSPNRTRISVDFEIKPRTLPARLFVQSMKLAKSNLTKRFRLRVAEYARDIEERISRMA